MGSDHCQIEIMWSGLGSQFKKPFHFEQFWLENLEFEEKIKSQWGEMHEGQEHSMYNFQQNLKGLKAKIKKWNKEEFGNIFREKRRLKVCLQEIQAIGTNEGYSMALKEEERILEAKLEEREKREEILWW